MVQMGPNPGLPSPSFAINNFIYYFAHNFIAIIYYCIIHISYWYGFRPYICINTLKICRYKTCLQTGLNVQEIVSSLSFLSTFLPIFKPFIFYRKKPVEHGIMFCLSVPDSNLDPPRSVSFWFVGSRFKGFFHGPRPYCIECQNAQKFLAIHMK
jgi:hypothetical protein